jgi:hypothetical protein
MEASMINGRRQLTCQSVATVSRASHALVILLVALLAAAVSGCGLLTIGFRADWWMHVRNDTEQPWLIRVQRLPSDPGNLMVARVDPGADGPAVEWRGEQDVPVEILDSECNVMGVLTSSDGKNYAVAELPGLTGHIEPWIPWGANRSPGIHDVLECEARRLFP